MKITTRVIEDPAGYPDAPPGSLAWRRWFATETKIKRRDIQQQAGEIAGRIISMRDGKYHETFNLPDFDTFCQKFLELTPDQVQAILSAKSDERVVTILTAHGTNQHTKKDKEEELTMSSPPSAKGGNSAEYLTARLHRDNPDIAARVDAGEISARAGAIEAGIITVKTPLERAQSAIERLGDAELVALVQWLRARLGGAP
jgi:hypothetical protein